MILAERTKAAIAAALHADSGAAFRQLQGRILPLIGDAYSGAREDGKRSHLGASVIGKECGRAVWYDYRWVNKKDEDPDKHARMLRLWNRGNLEEGRFIALLMMIGCRVVQQDRDRKQLRFTDLDGHYAGSMDGVVYGCPDAPNDRPGLVEFKTYNDKRFKDLVANGVKFTDEVYYVQMQQYMHKFKLGWALFMAVNKNDDDIHAEIVMYDRANAERYRDRAANIIFMDDPPSKLPRASPGRHPCNAFCDFMPVCLLGEDPGRSCRTCRFGEPQGKIGDDGKGLWWCRFDAVDLDVDAQKRGCDNYEKKPSL